MVKAWIQQYLIPLRIVMYTLIVCAVGFTHYYAYDKGRDSVEAKYAAASVKLTEKQRTIDQQLAQYTAEIATARAERRDLQRRLNDAIEAQGPNPSCDLSDDEHRLFEDLNRQD